MRNGQRFSAGWPFLRFSYSCHNPIALIAAAIRRTQVTHMVTTTAEANTHCLSLKLSRPDRVPLETVSRLMFDNSRANVGRGESGDKDSEPRTDLA